MYYKWNPKSDLDIDEVLQILLQFKVIHNESINVAQNVDWLFSYTRITASTNHQPVYAQVGNSNL